MLIRYMYVNWKLSSSIGNNCWWNVVRYLDGLIGLKLIEST